MSAVLAEDRVALERHYLNAEREYQAALTLEHYMEAVPHSSQKTIVVSAFEQIAVVRPDIQCFPELLIQYPRGGDHTDLGQVCPDTFVLVWDAPIVADGSFNTPFQPVGPLLVMEYVSKSNKRKDYVDNLAHYEGEMEVPYYVTFDPDKTRLMARRLMNGAYAPIPANSAGRYPVPELEVEFAVLDGWMRVWFRGELLPLTGELSEQLAETTAQLSQKSAQLTAAEAEIARLKAELAKLASGS